MSKADSTVHKHEPTEELLRIVDELIVPMARIERTMVQPFDRRRQENDAEHSYMLATLACALGHNIDPSLDLGLVAQYALVHDLVEVFAGDVTVWADDDALAAKQKNESAALEQIRTDYAAYPWFSETILAYERREDAESRYVYALDKMLAHILVLLGDYHPVHPTRVAYQRTEDIARRKIAVYPALLPYFDSLCTKFAQSPISSRQSSLDVARAK